MKTVQKPWGSEKWIHLDSLYCYKKIFFKAGNKCSLQYHDEKQETIYVESGCGFLWVSKRLREDTNIDYSKSIESRDIPYKHSSWTIYKIPIKSNDSFTIFPGMLHRIEALTDLTTLEVSTPEVDDCIRVEDDWDRPDGKIQEEHE